MSSTVADAQVRIQLVRSLKNVLLDLYHRPYPLVPSPPDLKKRASVALIIRLNPSYAHWPLQYPRSPEDTTQDGSIQGEEDITRIEEFFDQKWVEEADPEVLFIKRASRKGDRWTGHVALPGGGREPADTDDRATAIRETAEEIGLDLSKDNAIHAGNLPQRLVTTSWGKVPLMVLCPYIFLITRNDFPPLRLQPSEIASAHWVPMRSLLSPEMRTYEYQDVTNRLAKQEFGIKRRIYQAMLGKMLFSAVRLIPSESLYCTASTGFGVEQPHGLSAITQPLSIWIGGRKTCSASTDRPLLLWGLTLGVLADMLEFLPPHNALSLWSYPTFSPPDVRFIIWALSFNFRRRKARQLNITHTYAPAEIEVGLDSVPKPRESERYAEEAEPPEAGISGLGVGREHSGPVRQRRGSRSSRVGFMLDGYYEIIRKGVAMALISRGAVFLLLLGLVWRKYKRRHSR